MTNKTNSQKRDKATFKMPMIKSKKEADVCPTRKHCVDLWGGEEVFCAIRNLTKFELIHQKEEFIYKKNDPVTSLYVIQSGAVKLEKEIEGADKHVTGFYYTGDMIGSESMGLQNHHYSAIALKETWVCEIRIHKLATLGESATTILQRINLHLSHNLREIDQHLYNSRYLYTEHRVLGFLHSICQNDLDIYDGNVNKLILPMSKTDVANYLGLRLESVSRALKELKKDGIVHDNVKTRAIVIDKQKLLSTLGRAIIFGNCLAKKW